MISRLEITASTQKLLSRALSLEPSLSFTAEEAVELAKEDPFDYLPMQIARKLYFGVAIDGRWFDPLAFIANKLFDSPCFTLDVSELDSYIDGTDEIDVSDRDWFSNLMPSLNWWRGLADDLLHGTEVAWFEYRSDPAYAHHRERLSTLLNDVLTAYVPAWQEASWFADDWYERGAPASRELLKRYRLFTRYVCALAQERCPGANLEPLLTRS